MGVAQVIIGVPREIAPGETRVALVQANVAALRKKHKIELLVEREAGLAAGYTDSEYQEAGASLTDRATVFSKADVVLQVQTPGSNHANGDQDMALLRAGQVLIGMMDPLANAKFATKFAETQISGLAPELVPRITRAQAMDVLSF